MNDYAWRGVGLWLALCVSTLALLTSCGGGKANFGGDSQQVSETAGGAVPGTSQTITEDEISSLPAWQQDLLADPGWNQPPIPQRADTPMPAPSHEQLMEWQAKAQADGIISSARTSEGGKGSSYVTGYQPLGSLNRGEYNIPYTVGGTVPYGCKDSGGTGQPIHMKEKKLAAEPIPIGANQAITYVEKGITASNHFNTTGEQQRAVRGVPDLEQQPHGRPDAVVLGGSAAVCGSELPGRRRAGGGRAALQRGEGVHGARLHLVEVQPAELQCAAGDEHDGAVQHSGGAKQ
jgi:hypothetical protein